MPGRSIKTKISIIIGIIGLLLIATIVFSLYVFRGLQKNLDVQVKTRTVIIALKDNLVYLLNAETAGRGYVITGDSSYLEPYYSALRAIPGNMDTIRSLLKDQPVDMEKFDSLRVYIDTKLDFMKRIIRNKQEENQEMIRDMLILKSSKFYMDRVRAVNVALQQDQEERFADRQKVTAASMANSRITFIVEGLFAIFITIFLATLVLKELTRRARTSRRILAYNLELEQKNKEIEQFAYVASHDLQEPLRSITNFTGMLSQRISESNDEQAKKYTGFISNAATRMSNLIFSLLEYSRIGAEREKIPVNCNELIREVLEDLSAVITEKNADIRVGRLPVVYGHVYLKSLFQNLISNTLKFSKPGVRPVVQISAVEHEKEYEFSIADNGIGIDPKYFDRIFIIFQRLHGRHEYPGTGIGLSQCKKIVELHGGNIWVESEPGNGSIFKFTLPKT